MDFCKLVKPCQHLAQAITAIALTASPTLADELLMKDGSRLIGTVLKQDGTSLNFKTTYAGVIKVKWEEVDKVISDEAMTVLLKNKETRQIHSVKKTPDNIITITESGATETFSLGEIDYINPEPWRLGEGWNWVGKINTELNYERGNSEKDEYEGDFDMTFRRISHRLKFNGDYDREKSNDVLTDDDWRLGARYDYFVNDKLFYGTTLGLEHDRFADLQTRVIVGPLVGYEFYESKKLNLDIAGGPMYTKENFYDADNDDYVAFGWQFNFDRYLIPDRVQFYHRHAGLLDVSETDNFVWDSWTGFRFPIYAGIVASTEVQIEYDGGAQKDVDDTDTTYNIKLGYEW